MHDMLLNKLATQSFAGAGLILLLLFLRKVLSGKVRHTLIYGLWLLVALRMLIPLSLPNPISFHQQTGIPVQTAYIVQREDTEAQAGTSELVQLNLDTQSSAQAAPAQGQDATKQITSTAQSTRVAEQSLSIPQWMIGIWLFGVIISTAYMLLVNHRFLRRVFAKSTLLPLESPIPVYLANVPSPCLVGVFRPRIMLNEISARPENLPFALTHEQCHYTGWDHIWNPLRNVVLALFWFHPLVWIAAHCSRRDCERACDERATRALSRNDTIEYARTLIALVSPYRLALGTPASYMATTLPDMKKRVSLIVTRVHTKRWACALFAGLMLLSSVASFATGEAIVREITLPESYQETPLFYPTESGMWVVMGGRLYRQSGEDAFAEVTSIPSASQIVADNANVYVLDIEQKKILKLDFEGIEQSAWALPEELMPFKIEVAGNRLAILSGTTADMDFGRLTAEGTLYLLDKQSGALTQVKLGTVIDMCPDGKGGFLVLHLPMPGMTEALVSRLNLKSLSAQTVLETHIQSQNIAAESDMIYINGGGQLVQYDEQMQVQTVIPVQGCEYTDVLTDMRASDGTLHAWDIAGKRLLSIDVSKERSANKTVLTIVNNDGLRDAFDAALLSFLERHPDVEVRDVSMNADQYRTALMAGDDGIDILFQAAGSMSTLAEAGALVPLSDDPLITEALALSEWLPFEDIYSVSGKLYGIPGYVGYNMWRVDSDLALKVGFQLPSYPFTWRDVREAAVAAGLGRPGNPVLLYDYEDNPDILYNYVMTQAQIYGTLNFDMPGFREDMEAYRQMVKDGIIVLYEDGEPPQTPSAIVTTFSDITDETVPTPTVNGLEIAMMQSYGYCINVNSPNRELAMELLAELVKPEHQYQSDYGCVDTMLLKDSAPYTRTHYDDPTWGIPRYTERMEDIRQFASGKWVTWNTQLHPVGLLENTDILPKYMAGEISIDEFIRVLQSRADMMQYE